MVCRHIHIYIYIRIVEDVVHVDALSRRIHIVIRTMAVGLGSRGTLGTSVDWARGAAEHSKALVALLNPLMPRVHGDGVLHVSQLDAVVHHAAPLWCHAPKALTPEERRIGGHVAELVPDGATLQMGIGSVPDACLAALEGHRDLGVHTEMFSDGVLPLIEKGVINNARKSTYRGRTISAFLSGRGAKFDGFARLFAGVRGLSEPRKA